MNLQVENVDEQPQIIEECCACDEAKYEVTFEGLWSRHTHPIDFPTHLQLVHFSDIIGASHSADFRMWEYGGKASLGVKSLAEYGATKELESELKSESNRIRTIIKARGLWYPTINGKTFAVFRVDRKHHLMSLLSMIGPSPDWVVGVSALELCTQNCSWVGSKSLDLYPWDAGTDSGVKYMSKDNSTIPQGHIKRITNTSPNDKNSPFYNPNVKMKPLARLTISRKRIYAKPCGENVEPGPIWDTEISSGNTDSPVREFIFSVCILRLLCMLTATVKIIIESFFVCFKAECAVTNWSPFTSCPVSCGPGIVMRSRSYKNKMKAGMFDCQAQLVEKKMCESSPPCDSVQPNRCRTSLWSAWSDCGVTCGKGFRMRQRKYLSRKARKFCTETLVNKEMCLGAEPECPASTKVVKPECVVTQWSEWSPCTVTCGKGFKVRTRLFLRAQQTKGTCNVERMQKTQCMADRIDCAISPAEAKEVCIMNKQVGPCRGYFPRWYYDVTKGLCLQFIYGGCRGNQNNFEHYSQCKQVCEMIKVIIYPPLKYPMKSYAYAMQDANPSSKDSANCGSLSTPSSIKIKNMHGKSGGRGVIDCMVTEWTEWSQCSRTCGRGRRERRRMIKVEPKNGGEECPTKLIQKPVDCMVGQWTSWSDCSKSCGEAVRKRTRSEIKRARHGGKKCEPTVQSRYCDLNPCPSNSQFATIGSYWGK
ncbi:Spondin-1 [Nymphon striatum]|nr:Spondin-1 [Nymphon striatum]